MWKNIQNYSIIVLCFLPGCGLNYKNEFQVRACRIEICNFIISVVLLALLCYDRESNENTQL